MIFYEEAFPDHRKFLIILSSSLSIEAGMGKVVARGIGILESTCLMRIRRPTEDRNFVFQATKRAFIESIRGRKWDLFGVPKTIGMPRYFS